jgi:transcriptional regulator with XRE-family HTH domain
MRGKGTGPGPVSKTAVMDEKTRAFYVSVGSQFRTARKELTMTQMQLGEKLGMSHSLISYMEKGRSRVPAHVFGEMCVVLGLDPTLVLDRASGPRALAELRKKEKGTS